MLDGDRPAASLKTIVPDRPGHDRRYLLDSTKIRTRARLGADVDLRDGPAETVAWYADNEAWWRPLIGRSPVVEGTLGDAPTSPTA